jgi:Helix-hairpin-helix domain
MPVHNSEIAEMFEEVADLMEIVGANEFRIRAYRNASRVVAGLSKSAADLVHPLSPKGFDAYGQVKWFERRTGAASSVNSRSQDDEGRLWTGARP